MKDEKIRKKMSYYKTQRKKGFANDEILKMWNAKLNKAAADIEAKAAEKIAAEESVKAKEEAAKKEKEAAELIAISKALEIEEQKNAVIAAAVEVEPVAAEQVAAVVISVEVNSTPI